MFVSAEQKGWDAHLCYVMAAYRATQHVGTGCSPNLLMLGREVDCPIDLMGDILLVILKKNAP